MFLWSRAGFATYWCDAEIRGEAYAHFYAGMNAYHKERFTEAIEHFRASLKLAPDRYETHSKLAGSLRKIRDFVPAFDHAQRALELGGETAANLYDMISLARENEDFETARYYARRAIELRPSDRKLRGLISLFFPEEDAKYLALKTLNEQIDKNPFSASLLNKKAALLLDMFEFRECLEVTDQILTVDPRNVGALTKQVSALIEVKKLLAAEKAARLRIEVSPTDPHAPDPLVRVLIAMGKNFEAITIADKFLAQNHKRARTLALFAQALSNIGKYEQAFKANEESLAITSTREALHVRTILFLLRGQTKNAKTHAEARAANDPENPQSYYLLACAYVALRSFPQARAAAIHYEELTTDRERIQRLYDYVESSRIKAERSESIGLPDFTFN